MNTTAKTPQLLSKLLALGAVLALASGCVVYSNGRPQKGDVALQWGFEDASSCQMAGIETIIVSITGEDVGDGFERAITCGEGGATFTSFVEGNYTVQLEARDARGVLYYAATRSVFIDGGHTADLGLVLLYSTVQPDPTGSLMIDWSFLYPANQATEVCETAGVEYVGIRITDRWGALMLDQSVRCVDGPAIFDYFEPGDYDVAMVGLGSYRGRSVTLYDAPIFTTRVYAGQINDAGMIQLERVPNQFADFVLGWSFAGNNSCNAVGVDEVTVRIFRLDGDVLEVEETVSCDNEPLYYDTFVPGDYGVEVEAFGPSTDHWYGYLELGVGPGGLADVIVQTELYY